MTNPPTLLKLVRHPSPYLQRRSCGHRDGCLHLSAFFASAVGRLAGDDEDDWIGAGLRKPVNDVAADRCGRYHGRPIGAGELTERYLPRVGAHLHPIAERLDVPADGVDDGDWIVDVERRRRRLDHGHVRAVEQLAQRPSTSHVDLARLDASCQL